MQLSDFNSADSPSAEAALLGCCHCPRWAATVTRERPYSDLESLTARAAAVWESATEEEILEAFAAHPKIGDLDALRDRYSRAGHEQGQVREAQDSVLQRLQQLNTEYEARHGFIFIVCATGKSAAEIAELLAARLPNSRQVELNNGAVEQGKILQLRLRALFED